MKRFQLREIKVSSRMTPFSKNNAGKNGTDGGTSTSGSVTSTATVANGD